MRICLNGVKEYKCRQGEQTLKLFNFSKKEEKKEKISNKLSFPKFWKSRTPNKTQAHNIYFPRYYSPHWAMGSFYTAASRVLFRFWTTVKEEKEKENVLEFLFFKQAVFTQTQKSLQKHCGKKRCIIPQIRND